MNPRPNIHKLSPAEKRTYVRIRDINTNETIYHSDALHDGWEREVQIYLREFAQIEQVETDGATLILADGRLVAYIGDRPDIMQEAAE